MKKSLFQIVKKRCESFRESVKIVKNRQKQMQVTEHNVVDWNLNEEELNALIKLSKEKAISCKQEEDRLDELFYGLIAGKLIIMKNEEKETASN